MATQLSPHLIENEALSIGHVQHSYRVMRLRRLILCGLAAAMALATLAPIVVLAA